MRLKATNKDAEGGPPRIIYPGAGFSCLFVAAGVALSCGLDNAYCLNRLVQTALCEEGPLPAATMSAHFLALNARCSSSPCQVFSHFCPGSAAVSRLFLSADLETCQV